MQQSVDCWLNLVPESVFLFVLSSFIDTGTLIHGCPTINQRLAALSMRVMEIRVQAMIPSVRCVTMNEIHWVLHDINFYNARFTPATAASLDDARRYVVTTARAYSHYLLSPNDLAVMESRPNPHWPRFAAYRIDSIILTAVAKFGSIGALLNEQRARARHDMLLHTRAYAEQIERRHMSGYAVAGCQCCLCTQIRVVVHTVTSGN